MPVKRFVKQLDGCTYVSGGYNCTCAAHASWTSRATQGRLNFSSCAVRRETRDTVGGTNLGQMKDVAETHGINNTVLWRPGLFDKAVELIAGGRFGAHMNIGYSQIAGGPFDCFEDRFRGSHDVYVHAIEGDYAVYADPGADHRRPDIPDGFQKIPLAVLERAASALPLSENGPTLGQEYGSGRVYALFTPADPIVVVPRYRVRVNAIAAPLYDAPNGNRFPQAAQNTTFVATRSKVNGLWWYHILTRGDGTPSTSKGRYFKPNSAMEAHLV